MRPDHVKLILRHLLARYGKPTGFTYGLATTMKSVARHYCKLSDDNLDRLRDFCRRVKVRQKGLGEKNRTRLRPLLDPDVRDRLLLLPQNLMAEAQRQPLSRRAALLAQLAVVLEIAQMAPVRVSNLAALEIGRTLCFFGEGRREWAVIALPGDVVKNEISLEFPLTPESTRLIKTYIRKYLPVLKDSSQYLFPGRDGGSKQPMTLAHQVSAAILEHVGHRVHIHLLRHFAAMIYLQAYPGAYESVRRLLGHATASAAR